MSNSKCSKWAYSAMALLSVCVVLLIMLFRGQIDQMDPDIAIMLIVLTGIGSLICGSKYTISKCRAYLKKDKSSIE